MAINYLQRHNHLIHPRRVNEGATGLMYFRHNPYKKLSRRVRFSFHYLHGYYKLQQE